MFLNHNQFKGNGALLKSRHGNMCALKCHCLHQSPQMLKRVNHAETEQLFRLLAGGQCPVDGTRSDVLRRRGEDASLRKAEVFVLPGPGPLPNERQTLRMAQDRCLRFHRIK